MKRKFSIKVRSSKKKRKSRKGFTLIEILAVIIIIGILGIISVGAISSYIEDSRKSAFLNTAKVYIDAARDLKASDKLIQEPKDTEAILIPLDVLELEDNHQFSTPYGVIDKNKSYIIITNENNKFKYYITMIDNSGHALVMIEEEKLSKENIKASQSNNIDIKEYMSIKSKEIKETIDIDGVSYQVSIKDYDSKKTGTEEYITTTVLLDCNALDSFRVDVEEGWVNHNKKITINTITNKENYKYYLSTRSVKPLKNDSLWQEENNYEKDLGTYYAFVQSEKGEISEPVKVVIDKIDKVAPSCELEVQSGTKSIYGLYNTDVTIGFKSATDGIDGSTISGVKNYGIGSVTGSKTKVDSITGATTDTYTGYIVDNAGNTNNCEITIQSDGVMPTVSYNLAAGAYSTTKTVVITPQDTGHGLDYYNIKVTKNGTVVTNETDLKDSNYTVQMSDNGKYIIATKVVDKANNSISQAPLDANGYYYREYIIDQVTPTVTLTDKKKTSGTTISSDEWSNEGLNFVFTQGTVGTSGATIYYCKDTNNSCTPTTVVASGSTISSYNTTTGTYYIRYKIVSGAGLSSAVISYKAKIDTVIPTVTLTAKKKTLGTSIATGIWSDEGLNFVFTQGTVGASGATIYYCKDTNNSCTPTTVVASGSTISSYNTTTGTYYIRHKIVSGATNSSTISSFKAIVLNCSDGYYVQNEACQICPAGSYCSNGIKTSCPSGYTSDVQSSSQSDCYIKEATFVSGNNLNTYMESLAGSKSNITGFVKSTTEPTTSNNIINVSTNTAEPISMWYSNGVIYWYSPARTVYMNTYASNMFYNMTNITDISGLSTISFSKTYSIAYMFYFCTKLNNISALSNWDTSNIRYMNYVFHGCTSLTSSAPLKNWNTSQVTTFHDFFANCEKLNDLSGLVNFDTSKATDLVSFFFNCQSITNVDALSNWDISSAIEIRCFLYRCYSLTSIEGLKNWDVSSVKDASYMFFGDYNLKEISALQNWITSNFTDIRGMFSYDWPENKPNMQIQSLTPLKNWNVSNVTNLDYFCYRCTNLGTTVYDINSWDVSNVTSMSLAFSMAAYSPSWYTGE